MQYSRTLAHTHAHCTLGADINFNRRKSMDVENLIISGKWIAECTASLLIFHFYSFNIISLALEIDRHLLQVRTLVSTLPASYLARTVSWLSLHLKSTAGLRKECQITTHISFDNTLYHKINHQPLAAPMYCGALVYGYASAHHHSNQSRDEHCENKEAREKNKEKNRTE